MKINALRGQRMVYLAQCSLFNSGTSRWYFRRVLKPGPCLQVPFFKALF